VPVRSDNPSLMTKLLRDGPITVAY